MVSCPIVIGHSRTYSAFPVTGMEQRLLWKEAAAAAAEVKKGKEKKEGEKDHGKADAVQKETKDKAAKALATSPKAVEPAPAEEDENGVAPGETTGRTYHPPKCLEYQVLEPKSSLPPNTYRNAFGMGWTIFHPLTAIPGIPLICAANWLRKKPGFSWVYNKAVSPLRIVQRWGVNAWRGSKNVVKGVIRGVDQARLWGIDRFRDVFSVIKDKMGIKDKEKRIIDPSAVTAAGLGTAIAKIAAIPVNIVKWCLTNPKSTAGILLVGALMANSSLGFGGSLSAMWEGLLKLINQGFTHLPVPAPVP